MPVLSREELRAALAGTPPLVEDVDPALQLQPNGIDLRVERVQPLRARLFAEFGALVIIVGDTFLHGTAGQERGTLSFNAFPQVLVVALVIAFLWPYRKADPAPAIQRGS